MANLGNSEYQYIFAVFLGVITNVLRHMMTASKLTRIGVVYNTVMPILVGFIVNHMCKHYEVSADLSLAMICFCSHYATQTMQQLKIVRDKVVQRL